MKLTFEKKAPYLLVRAAGRLDAAWSEYFSTTLLEEIRKGEHRILLDASGLAFLSSAGIRALLQVAKALHAVRGFWQIVAPNTFVRQILETSGFTDWMQDSLPEDFPLDTAQEPPVAPDRKAAEAPSGITHFVLKERASLHLAIPADWKPWKKAVKEDLRKITLDEEVMAFGIGSPATSAEEALEGSGEFAALGGLVACQPPDGESPPDFLIRKGNYIPELHVLQALICRGEMGHLLRFAPERENALFPLSRILRLLLEKTSGKPAGFVLLAEIEGLVGCSLIRSPGRGDLPESMAFPEIRNWLSFCGERCHTGHQALVTGVVAKSASPFSSKALLLPLPSHPDMALHAHALVFPHQPLQNGVIGLHESAGRFFHGPPPMAVLHLMEDARPLTGLGESTFIRGACWFHALENSEDFL
ncbi:STAS domain-containing protein [Desulfobotulus sp.]|uniref:STAS domain-containing protein n=1 Tax=Desulfobotulus sp. TaxID=1940337 RepID=UPI002A3711E2|nr:STAS domain-containing protein [Desulfobotulus sp.]MDY0162452.1 STAS domain-containing protein [Desulfobotulus sp.]